MGLRAKGLGKNAETMIRRAAIAADTVLVTATPVDTGRARGNWVAAVGSPDSSTSENVSAQVALDQAAGVIGGWKLGMPSIYISNSLPYIIPLDDGSSAQAPRGMTKAAIAAARRELGRHKLLKLGSTRTRLGT